MTRYEFTCETDAGPHRMEIAIHSLVIAGWAGRDEAGIRHHIAELAALGVPPPSATPLFYRTGANLLTQAPAIDVLGPDTSGEAEPVVIAAADGLWLGLGSDHTDRKAETIGVALSKQLCPKPIGSTLWRLEDIARHWDSIVLRSYATVGGTRKLYQEGTLAALRTAEDLIARLPGGLPPGTAMFGGTLSTTAGLYPADHFDMELVDDKRGHRITHGYAIKVLPVVA